MAVPQLECPDNSSDRRQRDAEDAIRGPDNLIIARQILMEIRFVQVCRPPIRPALFDTDSIGHGQRKAYISQKSNQSVTYPIQAMS